MSKARKSETVTVRLTADMRTSLEAIGTVERRTLSNLMQLACARLIAERQHEKGPPACGPVNL